MLDSREESTFTSKYGPEVQSVEHDESLNWQTTEKFALGNFATG